MTFFAVAFWVACFLFVWWLFGIINMVIAYQLWPGDLDHQYYDRTSNRILCMVFGPFMTAFLLGRGLVILPVKWGCSIGMTLARKVDRWRNS